MGLKFGLNGICRQTSRAKGWQFFDKSSSAVKMVLKGTLGYGTQRCSKRQKSKIFKTVQRFATGAFDGNLKHTRSHRQFTPTLGAAQLAIHFFCSPYASCYTIRLPCRGGLGLDAAYSAKAGRQGVRAPCLSPFFQVLNHGIFLSRQAIRPATPRYTPFCRSHGWR